MLLQVTLKPWISRKLGLNEVVEADLVRETDKAYLLNVGEGGEHWVPKSQVLSRAQVELGSREEEELRAQYPEEEESESAVPETASEDHRYDPVVEDLERAMRRLNKLHDEYHDEADGHPLAVALSVIVRDLKRSKTDEANAERLRNLSKSRRP